MTKLSNVVETRLRSSTPLLHPTSQTKKFESFVVRLKSELFTSAYGLTQPV